MRISMLVLAFAGSIAFLSMARANESGAKESGANESGAKESGRWSREKAADWYNGQERVFGVNFLPSTAVNTTEMWQEETFDPETIDRELGWAAKIGVNSVRVNLQYLVWKNDPEGLLDRLKQFLAISHKHGISVTVCLLDDCNFAELEPYLGKQRDPIPGIHNGGWTPSPGHKRVVDRSEWPSIKRYVQAVVGNFADDPRVLMWDLYNEPGNSGMGDETWPLLEASFRWARQAQPSQPLTSGAWHHLPDGKMPIITAGIIELSDILTFHCYANAEKTAGLIKKLQAHGRPMICTEWMIRPLSAFDTHLPVFKKANVGCYSWGLVAGRTQTYFPWNSKQGTPVPDIWFCDLFRDDGSYYDSEEIDFIRRFNAQTEDSAVAPR